MRRLLLINPTLFVDGRRQPTASGIATMEPLALAYVAALTPRHWQVRIVDEVVEDIPEDYGPDLVGLTSLTVTAPRAYDIARSYRERGVPVVMGGIHASVMPDEVAEHVDTVCLGEAEGAWPVLIRDYEAGALRPRYVGRVATLAGLPVPRRQAYAHRYFMQLASASRGCRYRCEFCSLWRLEGGQHRTRPPGEVLDELENTGSRRPILFTDENMYVDREWALKIFGGLAERGLRRPYAIQASLDIADDDEMLATLKRSGCITVCMGFESVSEESLRLMRKGVNLRIGVAAYREKVSCIHDHGLFSSGTFVLGNDGDGPDIFERTVEFLFDAGIDVANLTILTPNPGTDLYERLAREDRLLYTSFPADYARYDTQNAVFRPLQMTPDQLEEGFRWTVQTLGSRRAAARRAWRTWRELKSPFIAALSYRWNRSGLFQRVIR